MKSASLIRALTPGPSLSSQESRRVRSPPPPQKAGARPGSIPGDLLQARGRKCNPSRLPGQGRRRSHSAPSLPLGTWRGTRPVTRNHP
ncbi:hypothetical protein HPG69_004358 [Diceros bicornis minor]|uniref:Uncharacterized protein n=1 Tax=Diceros bicornis minor TaxID=77932 RepID=A0A7J7E6W5_DICBM|nr:hypothetical protein HPG69_004358 [Diceros bicornis minor]